MDKIKYISSALDMAKYIAYRYYHNYSNEKKEISPIKLQKSLYFCFAYWGAFVRKSMNSDYVEENINLSEYLFPEKFQAWVYGPVIPDIFRYYNNELLEYMDFDPDTVFNEEQNLVKETIDSLLDELFSVSDFKLVSISHEDNCWKKNFDINSSTHNTPIDPQDIISEYTLRESL